MSGRRLVLAKSWLRGTVVGGAAVVAGFLCAAGCNMEDPGSHPALETQPSVLLYNYILKVADSGKDLAVGCVALTSSSSLALALEVPLEQEVVFEQRLVGRHQGSLSDGKDEAYYCGLGATEIGVGSAFEYNPRCYSVHDLEAFEVLSYELIGYQGESVDWESDDHWSISAIGLRVHLIHHDYGVVGVYADSAPCSGGDWVGFYTAIAPEEEEE